MTNGSAAGHRRAWTSLAVVAALATALPAETIASTRAHATARRPAGRRSVRIPEKAWDAHPAIRTAIAGYRGDAGRSVRLSDFEARALFDTRGATEPSGYVLHAAVLDYEGRIHDVRLEVDRSGAITERAPATARGTPAAHRLHPLGPVAARVRNQRIKDASDKVPGAALIRRGITRRAQHKRDLIADYAVAHDLAATLADQAADPNIAAVSRYSFHDDAEVYGVSDLHTGVGGDDPNEDLREGSGAFARFLGTLDPDAGRATVVCGGDCFDFMEQAPIDASLDELKAFVTRFVEGHAPVYRALGRAVVPHRRDPDRGLRMIFTRGNHDIQMVDRRVREHLIAEMARVGGVPPADRATFRERIAFAGDFAVLGARGEWIGLHGDAHDVANNWRTMANPYRYGFTRGGVLAAARALLTTGRLPALRVERHLETNFGYTMVEHLYKHIERRDPDIDNGTGSTVAAVARAVLTSPRLFAPMLRTMWKLFSRQAPHQQAALAATRADDAAVDLEWARRTRVHEQWGLASPEEVVARIERITAQMPVPFHERNVSRLPLVNLVRALSGRLSALREGAASERLLIGLLTTELPNVTIVDIGHTHAWAQLDGEVAGRGRVHYQNTGTWTRRRDHDHFTVTVARHRPGVGLATEGMFEFDAARGRLIAQPTPPKPPWAAPAGWTAPAVAAAP